MIPNFLHLPTYAVDYHYKTLVMRLILSAAPGPKAPLHQVPLTHRRARRAQLNTSRDAIAYNIILLSAHCCLHSSSLRRCFADRNSLFRLAVPSCKVERYLMLTRLKPRLYSPSSSKLERTSKAQTLAALPLLLAFTGNVNHEGCRINLHASMRLVTIRLDLLHRQIIYSREQR